MPYIHKDTYPSNLSTIEDIKKIIIQELENHNFSADMIFDIEISLEEALYNAIVHGNGLNSLKKIGVNIIINKDCFEITINDEGSGFDVDKLTKIDCTRTDRLLRGNGRGLFIIRKSMDEVVYNNSGKTITMKKYTLSKGCDQ
jgi:anti-sigma regulatory factor (Ser/Thr protein kinase)